MAWSDIPKDYRLKKNGIKYVMARSKKGVTLTKADSELAKKTWGRHLK